MSQETMTIYEELDERLAFSRNGWERCQCPITDVFYMWADWKKISKVNLGASFGVLGPTVPIFVDEKSGVYRVRPDFDTLDEYNTRLTIFFKELPKQEVALRPLEQEVLDLIYYKR